MAGNILIETSTCTIVLSDEIEFNVYMLLLIFQFFAESGFPCPSRRNPSDHFLRCVNSDFDVVTATLKGSQRLRV